MYGRLAVLNPAAFVGCARTVPAGRTVEAARGGTSADETREVVDEEGTIETGTVPGAASPTST